MNITRLLIILIIISIFGCAHILQPNLTITMEGCTDRISLSINEAIDKSYKDISIMVASPVNATTLRAGNFGLAMRELLIVAMAKKDINVVDIEPKGAEAILVSTYIVRRNDVVMTSKLVDLKTNDVIAFVTTTLYKSASVYNLLNNQREVRLYEN